ncbi:hypothetical protein JCM12856_30920 [Spirochaeta dissipatitropha]
MVIIYSMTTSKSYLKAKLLEVLRQMESSHEEVIVTDHNRPVAVIQPYSAGRSVDELFASFRGKLVVHADLTEPISEDWENI